MSSNPTQITYNGITFGGGNGYTITNLEGVEAPPYRVSEDDLTNLDGGIINGVRYGMRTITIEGQIIGTSVSDYFAKRDALIAAVARTDTARTMAITLWNSRSRSISVKPVSKPEIPLVPGENNFASYQVIFRAEDPFFEDGTSAMITVDAAASGGVQIPTPIRAPLGSSTGATSISNSGAVNALPVYRIKGQITNPTLSNNTTGDSFTLNTTIAGGKYIEVYQQQGQLFVKDQDGTNQFSVFSGVYPVLEPGSNTIQLSGTAVGVNSEVVITYSNRYINI